MGKKKTSDEIGDAIRSAFKRSGWSMLKLAKRSGLGYASVYDFVTYPEKMIYTTTASRLSEALGLVLTQTGKRKDG
ncbi:MAG: helix-turn-helix domain-containing protein [Phycisphaerae bacterium]